MVSQDDDVITPGRGGAGVQKYLQFHWFFSFLFLFSSPLCSFHGNSAVAPPHGGVRVAPLLWEEEKKERKKERRKKEEIPIEFDPSKDISKS